MARIDPERAAALYAETKSVIAVAAYIGASASGVWNALKRAGVAVQSRSENMKALHADPEFKARHAAAAAERMKALNADPEFKERHAERLKALHADPEFKERHAERLKALHADPEFKARNAERMKALHADPEFKARNAERLKALNADPEFKARHRAAIRRHFDGCDVPSWVPDDLRDDYIDVARLSGEDAAASHVRRLKREAAL